MTSVLIIDAELAVASSIARDLTHAIHELLPGTRVDVAAEASFAKARARIKLRPPAVLVTALQLHEYNGLHLAYLAGAATRSIIHTDSIDLIQAREVRAAGAFYEIRHRLHLVLPPYVTAALPPEDRRESTAFDRRRLARGGRRAADGYAGM